MSHITRDDDGSTSRATFRRRLLHFAFIAAIGLGPACSCYLVHYLGIGATGDGYSTGFLQYDMAYYPANGREIFERGNGLGYPSPYDNNAASPVIYYHWLPWLFGAVTRFAGFEPGAVQLFFGAVGALACSLITYRLVELRLGSSASTRLGYVIAMWGGGLLTLLFLIGSVTVGNAGEVFRSDLPEDWWLMSWGRNLVLPTEAVYHALMAGAWLAAIKERRFIALACVALLAATHPFSGVQAIGILGGWIAWEWIRGISRDWRVAAIHSLIGLVFAWYYGVYLRSFEAHRYIQEVWSIDWSVPWTVLIPEIGIVAVFAIVALRHSEVRARTDVQFLCIAFLVSLALAKHDAFFRSIQPMHFVHGYQWFPLFLIGAPLIVQAVTGAARARRPVASIALAGSLIGLLLFDNAMFYSRRWVRPNSDLYLTHSEVQLFDYLESNDMRGVLVASDHEMSYLAATYTPVIPYVGHKWLTPDFDQRRSTVDTWFQGKDPGEFLEQVQYVVLSTPQSERLSERPEWREVFRTHDLVLFVRTGDATQGR